MRAVQASAFGGPDVLDVVEMPEPVPGPGQAVVAVSAVPRPGEQILVTAAAGGLGTLLVQLCGQAGCRVIAAAGNQHKLALARRLGAGQAVDYTQPGWQKQVLELTGGHGLDVVFDGAGGTVGQAAFEVTAAGGRFSAHGTPAGGFAPIDPSEARRREISVTGIDQVQFTPAKARKLTARALAEAAAGRLAAVIGRRWPLDQAAAAHRAIEGRAVTGKTLLEV